MTQRRMEDPVIREYIEASVEERREIVKMWECFPGTVTFEVCTRYPINLLLHHIDPEHFLESVVKCSWTYGFTKRLLVQIFMDYNNSVKPQLQEEIFNAVVGRFIRIDIIASPQIGILLSMEENLHFLRLFLNVRSDRETIAAMVRLIEENIPNVDSGITAASMETVLDFCDDDMCEAIGINREDYTLGPKAAFFDGIAAKESDTCPS